MFYYNQKFKVSDKFISINKFILEMRFKDINIQHSHNLQWNWFNIKKHRLNEKTQTHGKYNFHWHLADT